MANLGALFEAVSDYVDKAVLYLVFLIVSGMVLITTLQVICRVFFTALTWSEELSRYLLVWGTFFAATLAYKRGSHIAITFVVESLPRKMQPYLTILTYLLSLAFFMTAAVYGWQMIKMQIFQISPAIGLPMQFVYLSIPASLIIMVLHAISGIVKQIGQISAKEGA